MQTINLGKSAVLAVVLLCSIKLSAQKESVKANNDSLKASMVVVRNAELFSRWGTGFIELPGIIMWSDSTLEIRGDTLKILRNLWHLYERVRAENYARENVMECINWNELSALLKFERLTWALKNYREEMARLHPKQKTKKRK